MERLLELEDRLRVLGNDRIEMEDRIGRLKERNEDMRVGLVNDLTEELKDSRYDLLELPVSYLERQSGVYIVVEIPIGDEDGRTFKIEDYPEKSKRGLFLEAKNRRLLERMDGGVPLVRYDQTSLGFPMTFNFSSFCRVLEYLESKKKKGDGWESEWNNW